MKEHEDDSTIAEGLWDLIEQQEKEADDEFTRGREEVC